MSAEGRLPSSAPLQYFAQGTPQYQTLPQYGQQQYDQSHVYFRLWPIKWLVISLLFYYALVGVALDSSTTWDNLLSYHMQSVGLIYFGLNICECVGAVMFGLLLTKQHFHHHHSNSFITISIVISLVVTVVGLICLNFVHIVPIIWLLNFASRFLIGGCSVVMISLLGWNTNSHNAPFWFGMLFFFLVHNSPLSITVLLLP